MIGDMLERWTNGVLVATEVGPCSMMANVWRVDLLTSRLQYVRH